MPLNYEYIRTFCNHANGIRQGEGKARALDRFRFRLFASKLQVEEALAALRKIGGKVSGIVRRLKDRIFRFAAAGRIAQTERFRQTLLNGHIFRSEVLKFETQ